VAALATATDKKFDQIVASFQRGQREARGVATAVDGIKHSIDALPQNVYIDFFLRGHGQSGLPPGTSVDVPQDRGPGQRNGAPRGFGADRPSVQVNFNGGVYRPEEVAALAAAAVGRQMRRSRGV